MLLKFGDLPYKDQFAMGVHVFRADGARGSREFPLGTIVINWLTFQTDKEDEHTKRWRSKVKQLIKLEVIYKTNQRDVNYQ